MPSDPITQQLAAMLGQDVQDAETDGDPTEAARNRAAFERMDERLRAEAPARHPNTGVDNTPAPVGLQTGRGPTGRLRNFRAMNDGKLRTVWQAVCHEDNDPEAMGALHDEMGERGLL